MSPDRGDGLAGPGASPGPERRRLPRFGGGRRVDVLTLGIGLAAFGLGTALGRDAGLLRAVVTPPAIVRACFVGAALLAGLALLAAGVGRIDAGRDRGADGPADLIRGVRLAFLALAALAAAGGWLVASALPIVVALVIAAVDVVETTFVLILVGTRRVAGK